MHLVLIAAQSLDGYITKHAEPGTAFTSPEDKSFFRSALPDFDVYFFGGETYRVSGDYIRERMPGTALRVVLTRTPERYTAEAGPGRVEFTDAAPAALVDQLAARGLRRGAILGGSQIHSLFLEAGLVDELWLTVEPVLFGQGTPLLHAPAEVPLEFRAMERLSANTLLLKYGVPRRGSS
jgi:dihydrofolate reductase